MIGTIADVMPLPVIVPWLTTVTTSLALKPSMLMPEPLSPWIVAPALLVTLIVKLTVASTAPPVMPCRPPSIRPPVSLVICTPELFCASTPSLLLPVVVVDLIVPALKTTPLTPGLHRVGLGGLHHAGGDSC